MMALADDGTALTVAHGGSELFRYVYRPDNPQLESPRPYFHPVTTLRGDVVTSCRPDDHVWHKGIALSLPHVGPDNFWGGPTFRDGGYVQLRNDGAMRHDGFDQAAVIAGEGRPGGAVSAGGGAVSARGDVARIDERLTWVTEAGEARIGERRRIAAAAWPGEQAWGIAFETTLANISAAPIVFASPTTEGRPNAGYGGLFWRGPRSFTGGRVILPDAAGGDELMGRRAPWLAFAGQPDGQPGRWSTLVFADSPATFSYPSQWFVRSTPFAAVCPAPFFAETYTLPAGQALTLRHDVVIADGEHAAPACARLAGLPADLLSPGD
jgi:Methane oxygenase PmoA